MGTRKRGILGVIGAIAVGHIAYAPDSVGYHPSKLPETPDVSAASGFSPTARNSNPMRVRCNKYHSATDKSIEKYTKRF